MAEKKEVEIRIDLPPQAVFRLAAEYQRKLEEGAAISSAELGQIIAVFGYAADLAVAMREKLSDIMEQHSGARPRNIQKPRINFGEFIVRQAQEGDPLGNIFPRNDQTEDTDNA